MAFTYHSNARATSSTRDHFLEPPSLLSRLISALPSGLGATMQKLFDSQQQGYGANTSTAQTMRIPRSLRRLDRNCRWSPRSVASLPHLFIVVWVVLLLWGERWVFRSSVDECRWENWETWPKDATPHHLVFLADPQIIDAHSYPGRPWPLDKFTIMHTDNYMKRSYISLQDQLHPDTIFFLGDLFDGGREWKTAHGNTQDPSWANGLRPSGEQAYVETWGKRYGEDYWLHEYDRFGKIFYDFWNLKGADPGPWQRGRKIISTLPGNHDLGFGQQIKIPIRNRFETYFGEGNRVDVIGNHTFVSVDSVSLSASGDEHGTKEITQPVEDFLTDVQKLKRRAVVRELSIQAGEEKVLKYVHRVEDLEHVDFTNRPSLDPGPSGPELPTILLTHVPLYRDPGTPCGPMRERHPPETPPKGQTTPVFPDHGNAISISKGYQYQNVLSEDDSVRLVSAVGNVKSVFSGDDHDYCEIVHPSNKNSAREITVKSMSWAQGVRKPGFLLLSMWNPIDSTGLPIKSTSTPSTTTTMQSHLCLLPDQISIFIRYLGLIVLTLLALSIRAVLVPLLNLDPFSSPPTTIATDSLLPTTKNDLKRSDPEPSSHRSSKSSASSASSNNIQALNLAPRSTAARTRSVSPAKGYGLPASQVRFATPPLINAAGYNPKWDEGKFKNGNASSSPATYDFNGKSRREVVPLKGIALVWREIWTSIWRVAWVVICVYLWLAYYG